MSPPSDACRMHAMGDVYCFQDINSDSEVCRYGRCKVPHRVPHTRFTVSNHHFRKHSLFALSFKKNEIENHPLDIKTSKELNKIHYLLFLQVSVFSSTNIY